MVLMNWLFASGRLFSLALLCAGLGGIPVGAQTGPLVGKVTTSEAWMLYRPGAGLGPQ